jgi:hypothetical protein
MAHLSRSLPLLLSLSLSALGAACSSSTTDTAGSAPVTGTEATPTEPPPADDGTTAPSKTPPLRDAIDPSILAALKSANVDIAALPDDLGEIAKSPSKLKAVMKTFTIALGTTCDGCHAKNGSKIDYEAVTPKKNVAKKMWTSFVRGLQKKDGSALYCDSCHQGKMEFLDRADPKALGAWMKNNFVEKLARRDGAEHACATCHGEPFDGDILAAWSK